MDLIIFVAQIATMVIGYTGELVRLVHAGRLGIRPVQTQCQSRKTLALRWGYRIMGGVAEMQTLKRSNVS